MSLVDYASSDEDEADVIEEEKQSLEVLKDESEASKLGKPPSLAPPVRQNRSALSSSKQTQISHSSNSSTVKLPDAALLLNSPYVPSDLTGARDHSSRVAAAMAECASRKRETNGSASSSTRSKVPRGNLPHTRSIPETGGGLLVPPQLKGRSNVVTEDISKLFVRKQANNSS